VTSGWRVPVEGVYRLKTNTARCLAALVLAGAGLSACQTVPSDYSTSFTESRSSSLDISLPSFLRGSDDTGLEAEEVATPRAKPTTAAELLSDLRPRIVDADVQCVPFAREASGIEIRGDANRWWKLAEGRYTRARRPAEGAVLVMRGYRTARRGHVAVVRQVVDPRTIVVDHANWGNDGRIYLSAPILDESPKNDWSRVRVWHTPTNQWGKRIYKAKGFILPTTAVAGAGMISGSN
jgi:CHAP domain